MPTFRLFALNALFLGVAQAGDLMVGGDFTACGKNLGKTAFSNGGRLSLYQEEATWNKCGKLEIDRAHTNADGTVTLAAVAVVGTDGKAAGVKVTPGRLYDFALEVRSDKARRDALACGIRALAWEKGVWKDMAVVEKSTPGRVRLKSAWTLFRGSFRAPEGKTRAAVMLQLWAKAAPNAPMPLNVGDCLYFDNVRIEEAEDRVETFRSRFKDLAFTVARIPVDSDYACPFVPRACFHPEKEIVLKGAVNERLELPVAVLNLRDRAETYVVRLETSTFDPEKTYADKQFNGAWGLAGFPADQIVAREAVRFKDVDDPPVTTRYEMLPKMDEACTITAPAGEAGLAWFDFDTAGVKPGTYKGRLRVIPLSEPSEWKEWKGVAYHQRVYAGAMQDVPVSLVVRPIVLDRDPAQPGAFFQSASTEDMFRRMHEIGARDFMTSPWNFQWEKTPEGRFDFSRPRDVVEKGRREVVQNLEWARARGFRPTFLVGFSAYDVFKGLNGLGNAPCEKTIPLWIEYLKGVNAQMNAWGVRDGEYAVEVFDEPDPKRFPEAKTALAEAKKTLPNVRLVITLGAHVWTAEQFREMDPYVDGWILWQHGYFSRPDHLAYVKDALARGKTVWHYTCGTSGRQPIYPTYRLHPWFGYRHHLTGNQFFIIQEQTGGYGPSDFKVHASAGILYRSFESTMPSVRYMSMRRGVEDVKYLALLEKTAGDRSDVRNFLAEAAERVVESERHDPTTPERMRERAAELLMKYAK